MTDVIEGASVRVSTLIDGTLRLTVDIEPCNANAAFALFGAPGRAMALAALKDGAAAIPDAVIPASEKPKGGQWAKLAGMWCADTDFWDWSNSTRHSNSAWHVVDAWSAAMVMRDICGIDSRTQLDHDASALNRFKDRIRTPFVAWMQVRGIVK